MTDATDAIIIGSGFGGAMAAYELVRTGLRVSMLERGPWVPRGAHNWDADGTVEATRFYSTASPYRVERRGGKNTSIGSIACVGGPSVFYGGVSLRLRERDFEPTAEIVGDSGARWPFGYEDLEPFYCVAEHLLGVAGDLGTDPTEPFHSRPYPSKPAPLSPAAVRLADAASRLGLRPFRLPLAIRYYVHDDRPPCAGCATCDTFACAIEAKNDVATRILPTLIRRGLTLRERTVATRVHVERGRAVGVEVFDERTSKRELLEARTVVLAAGALGTPHLILASGLERLNPAGAAVGRYLMRHCNGVVYGVFGAQPARSTPFHKQIGIHDFYFGRPKGERRKLGSLQQVVPPPAGLISARVPSVVRPLVPSAVRHAMGVLAMAEDCPRLENGVRIDPDVKDALGLPQLVIEHRYADRDLAAREELLDHARRVLARAGAIAFREHVIDDFSHALGTVRMGDDPKTCPLDPHCQFRGVRGLSVVDASCLPRSGAVDPSLTIAANALRVGAYLRAQLEEAGDGR